MGTIYNNYYNNGIRNSSFRLFMDYITNVIRSTIDKNKKTVIVKITVFYHEPIPADKLQRIKSCKTWEDVYVVYNEVVSHLSRSR
jgi:hypothetical protein